VPDPILTIALMCAILAAAGMVQGVSGFGSGLLSVALIGLIWPDPKEATIVPLLASFAICCYILWSCRTHVPWRLLRIFLIATAIGAPVGVWLLTQVSEIFIYAGIGLLLMVSVGWGMLPDHRSRPWHRVWLGAPMGFFAGALGGAFNTGGPPAIAFFSNQTLNRFQYAAALQVVFLTATVIRLISLIGVGMFPPRIALVSAVGMIPAVAGVTAGLWLLHRTSEKRAATIVRFAQLILAGIYFIRVLRVM